MTKPGAWYESTLREFLACDLNAVIGQLSQRAAEERFGSTVDDAVLAWADSVRFLRSEFASLTQEVKRAEDWWMLLEYSIPRRNSRIDAVLLTECAIYPIELKIGSDGYSRHDRWQIEDYALDLRDFHLESRDREIHPILICTNAETRPEPIMGSSLGIHCVGSTGLSCLIVGLERTSLPGAPPIDPIAWGAGRYAPTPSIVQATQHLFAGHSVRELSHAYADNLRTTLDAIQAAVTTARDAKTRTICFVTGVPGAGKTLAGLAAMHDWQGDARHVGAYLSGNGPLVRVLREAIVRDATTREMSKSDALRRAKTLIQNVHEFISEYAKEKPDSVPPECVVVFDEAQRAWSAEKLHRRHRSITRSEPALFLDIMSRAPNWSVIVALVGGGQEIHTGEAGLAEWGASLNASQTPWNVVVSPEALQGGVSVSGSLLFDEAPASHLTVEENIAMHLSVSVRSPRALRLAEWVDAVLAGDAQRAAKAAPWRNGFRMGLTRDLEPTRRWLRDISRHEVRPGLVSSSGNLRLRSYGLEMDPEFLAAYPIEHWFLGQPSDIRSSHSLEVAMSEFKVQGLELDAVGLAWGDDLTINGSGRWEVRRFKGTKWQNCPRETAQTYVKNKYRVLLTRAREGLIIWVPRGCSSDPTRDPARLDRTAKFLLATGIPLISEENSARGHLP